MLQSARATNAYYGINQSSTLAIPLSIDYIAGKMMVVRSISANCQLLELPVSNSIKLDSHVDLLAVVPSQIKSLLSDAEAPRKIGNLLVGGAPLDDDLRRQVVGAGIRSYIGYGMTETCSHVALRLLADEEKVYKAMPDIRFSSDSRGCLVINSDKFSWHTLTTNDVVSLKSDSQFEWLGRADNVINSGGVKIHPEQVENIIRHALPDVAPFYIVGANDPTWGEHVAMVIQGLDVDIEKLRHKLSGLHLPPYSMPKEIVAVRKLPTTPNGNKLLRLPPENL